MRIFLPKLTPSLNVSIREHWSKRRREKHGWVWMLISAVGQDQGPFSRIGITRVSKGVLDPDNLSGGCKQILDAIRDLGWIADDDAKSVTVEYAQKKPGADEDQGMILEFWE